MTNYPSPPPHLSPDAAKFWRDTVAEYELAPHHLLLLEGACQALDRALQARAELAANGAMTYRDDRGIIRPHPAAITERNSMTQFARLLRELDLDGPAKEPPRPPLLARNRRR